MGKPGYIKVWDPLVRVFHWALAGAFALAYLTEDDFLDLHVVLGYGLLALIAVRVAWGVVGSRHARFRDFVRHPAVILGYLRDILRFRAHRYLGHNPAGGAMVVALMAAVTLTALAGLTLYGVQEFSGPLAGLAARVDNRTVTLVEAAHELLATLTLVLIALHVFGVLSASLQHRENLVQAMFTGYKRAADHPEPGPARADDEFLGFNHGE